MGDLSAAARLNEALDAVEVALARLSPGADPDAINMAMGEPVRALGVAAKALLKPEDGALEP